MPGWKAIVAHADAGAKAAVAVMLFVFAVGDSIIFVMTALGIQGEGGSRQESPPKGKLSSYTQSRLAKSWFSFFFFFFFFFFHFFSLIQNQSF